MCVSHTLFQRVLSLLVFHFIFAGGNGPFMSPLPTKLLMNWEDITTDHRDVPAKNFMVMKQCFGSPFRFPCVQAVCFSSSARLLFQLCSQLIYNLVEPTSFSGSVP